MVGIGTTLGMLLDRIRDYRRANAIPVGLDFESEVEREVCKFYPQECEESHPLIPNTAIRLSLSDVVDGTMNLLRFKLSGSVAVPQEEANRRAEVCINCGLNGTMLAPCSGCDAIKKATIALAGNLTTPYDDRLQSCLICHCFNAVAVHIPLEIQNQSWNEQQKLQFQAAKQSYSCWKAG
jgi:hypothetical protein